MKLSVGEGPKIAVRSVIGHIAFEKDDMMSEFRQRPEQTAQDGGVAVSPGRADRQAEDNEFHSVAFPPISAAKLVGFSGE
jgi:hypothetical protein